MPLGCRLIDIILERLFERTEDDSTVIIHPRPRGSVVIYNNKLKDPTQRRYSHVRNPGSGMRFVGSMAHSSWGFLLSDMTPEQVSMI